MNTPNRHFKTEGWLLPVLLGAPVVLGLAAAFVMPWVSHDRGERECTRAGGTYEEDKGVCIKKGAKP
jgi:hypothetical protein